MPDIPSRPRALAHGIGPPRVEFCRLGIIQPGIVTID
jgi:hypothetical protein